MKKALLALTIVVTVSGQVLAATKYWDINGATAGAGGATPTGNWNTSTANWTTDSTGGSAATTWANTDAAIFSASNDATGIFTVTTTVPIVASSILVEEGTVQHAGTSTNTLTTSGASALTVANGATFSVAVASSFTPVAGSVATLNGGTLQNRNGGVGSSFLTSTSANGNMKITLGTGGGRVSVTGASTAISIYTGLIDGTGPLFIDGTNNATFRLTTVAATYSGATTITSGGRLQLSTTANVLPSATALTINSGGAFDLQTNQTVASLAGGGNFTGNTNGNLTITGTTSTAYSGVWSGGRINVNKSGGTGTLTLSGVNTSTFSFTQTNGTTIVTSTGSLGGDIMDLNVNGGTLRLQQAAEKIENLAGTGGTLNLDNASLQLITDPVASTTFAGTITGTGGLRKDNALSGTQRTLTLTGANTYDGVTTVSSGIISVGNAAALGSTIGDTEVLSGGEILFTGAGGSVTTSENFRIAGAGSTDNGAIAVIASAAPTLSGTMTLTGNATVTVSAPSTALFSGATAFSGTTQTLTLAGGTTAGGVVSGLISLGTGGLTKANGGKWTLSNATGNSYSGATAINAGTLVASNTSGSATGSGNVNISNGTLMGHGSVSGPVTITGTGSISPGESIGSLGTGALSFGATGSFTYEMNTNLAAAVMADLLDSSGSLSIVAGAALAITDAGTTALADGTKLTMIAYNGTWNGGTFATYANNSVFTLGPNEWRIRYNDLVSGGNFPAEVGDNAAFVTLTIVPEASSIIAMGLTGIFAAAAVWIGKRRGIAVLNF